MNVKDIPNKSLSNNETLQWIVLIGGTIAWSIFFYATYTQLKLNQKQLKALEDKEKRDHPEGKF